MKVFLIISLFSTVILAALHGLMPAICRSSNDLGEKTLRSPRFSNGKFTRVGATLSQSTASFAASTWDYLFSGHDRTPASPLPSSPVDLSSHQLPDAPGLTVTWLGHSSLILTIDGRTILTDPVFEKSVSFIGPSRLNGDVPIDMAALPDPDAVIISHDHYDHLNKASVLYFSSKTSRFIVPLGVGRRLLDWGIDKEKIVELDWWEEYRLDSSLTIAATPAQHFSGRGLNDRNRTLWASWAIIGDAHRVFFSGDSGYFEGFKTIGNTYGPFDMTFLECGAYSTSWPVVHMFPEQTLQAHLDLKGNFLHPIHWGTFNLAPHAWYEPMERLTAAADAAKVKVATPVPGDTTVLEGSIPDTRWWRKALALEKLHHLNLTSGGKKETVQ